MNKAKIKLNFKLMGKYCVVKMFNYMLQSTGIHKLGVSLGFFPFTQANLTEATPCLLECSLWLIHSVFV